MSVLYAGGESGERELAACRAASAGMRVERALHCARARGSRPIAGGVAGVLQSRLRRRLRALAAERAWDSVRFGARAASSSVSGNEKDLNGGHIQIRYVCERDHRPVEHGTLRFDAITTRWEETHSDSRVQRMAECFLASYLEKRKKREAHAALAS